MQHRFLLIIPTLALALIFQASALANSSRLTVINEVVDQIIPLYLSRLGSYYAELYLEPSSATDVARSAPLDLGLTISFLRREQLVLSRDVAISIAPGESVATLFYLNTPYDLPQRKGLEVVVNFHDVDPQFNDYYEGVRLQLTRKIQIGPFKF